MLKYLTVLIIFALSFLTTEAQFVEYTQTVKGNVRDKESRISLGGVKVAVSSYNTFLEAYTDSNGDFKVINVPIGKHVIVLTYPGYQNLTVSDVLLTSAKEVVLPFDMEESAINIAQVEIKSTRGHLNEMAIVSAKTFEVQETERYAGSRADPSRMASNFAGVQGGDDSRNDIVIRGNTPQGLLWRLEGIDIPNPNHFAIAGTTGGPVSMLNNKTLANSDFYTGAFPSEYGNGIAGVFDLRMRNGNKDKYEFTGQFGFLGTELAAEGPISRKTGSSFLFTYRYSTLKIFEGLNIKIGTSAVPNYQDAAVKLNFPLGKKANLSFFGIGGLSHIDIVLSTLTSPSTELYGESDQDQYFTSNTMVLGATYSYTIDRNTYTKLTIAQTGNFIKMHNDYIFRDVSFAVDSLKNILGAEYTVGSTTAHWLMNKKLSSRQTLRFGIINTLYQLSFIDSSRQSPVTTPNWNHRQDYTGSTDLVQGYVQYKYRPNDNTSFTFGLHGQYFMLGQSKSLEPRLGMRHVFKNNNAVTLGYGLHSQTQPLYIYFQHLPQNPASALHNEKLDFTRSHHFIAGYEHALTQTLNLRIEAYYQYLFNVPIEIRQGSSYTTLDQGSGYSRVFPDTLQNTGTGYNTGLELTLEKRFSKGYYFLFSGSVFDSKAKGNDGVYRSTDYNSNYAFNLLGGYEFKMGANSVLITGIKITYAGGKLYSPANTAASNAVGDLVVIDSLRNTLQAKDYFRLDLKLGARFNTKKVTHEFGLDLVNILGVKNVLSQSYSSELALQGSSYPFYTKYQLGFLPVFYYRIDFSLKSKENVK